MMAYRFALLVFWNDLSLIHPDDLENLQKYCPGGRNFVSFEELGKEDDYSIVSIQDLVNLPQSLTVRIKPEVIREYQPTKYVMGQKVRVITGTPRVGWIRDIHWHWKNKHHIYFLRVGDLPVTCKKKQLRTRYYQEQDLEAL